MFRDLQKAHAVFTDIAAHVLFGANLSFHNQTLNGQGVLVSGSYFPVLGLTPARRPAALASGRSEAG